MKVDLVKADGQESDHSRETMAHEAAAHEQPEPREVQRQMPRHGIERHAGHDDLRRDGDEERRQRSRVRPRRPQLPRHCSCEKDGKPCQRRVRQSIVSRHGREQRVCGGVDGPIRIAPKIAGRRAKREDRLQGHGEGTPFVRDTSQKVAAQQCRLTKSGHELVD